MNDKFNEAVEDFLNQRVNDLGEAESEEVMNAAIKVRECEIKLTESLSQEQLKLWNEYETAFNLLDGEEIYYYYVQGFHDAINFIFKLGGKEIEG